MAKQSWVLKKLPKGGYELVDRDHLSAWMEKHYPPTHRMDVKIKRPERGRWVWKDGKLLALSAEIIPIRRARGLQIIKDIEPFRNVAIDHNEVIGGRRQKRDMMRARGVVEAGDMPTSHAHVGPKYDARKHQESVVTSLKKALYQHGLGD